ncbi:MAG TPA: WG repeat-containing protein, partial [Pyrinomonadaceae bacterium]|nr:WG repeat-containing protein [Pyrinomonadaceae bacterium]
MSVCPAEQRQFADLLQRGARVFICLVVLVCACAVQGRKVDANKQDASALFVVRQNDLWGYIDRTGKIVIKP